MPVSRLKNINFTHVNDPNQDIKFTVPKPYSFGKGGGSVSLKYNEKLQNNTNFKRKRYV